MLHDKVILVVSPQDWGKMLLSKHHYALELAKAGNTVFFLNPPDMTGTRPFNSIAIEESGLNKNLFFINHRLYFPYLLKFKALWLFHALMKRHVKAILNKINKPVDIVWSFDIGNLYPLRQFGQQPFKIFHPVDEPNSHQAILAAQGAGIIFSVTQEILDKYKDFNVPRIFINHGVTEGFLKALNGNHYQVSAPIKVGYAGNLLRPDIDRETTLQIIAENPEVGFHLFGSYSVRQTNIGGSEDASAVAFIDALKKATNVKLHGVLDQQQLAAAFLDMDAFLVCYDIIKDQSHGTNYHKLMEYLATGRVVIANNITTYATKPELIIMTKERDNNKNLPALFKSVIAQLNSHNDAVSQQKRRSFAAANSYPQQLQKIAASIQPLMGH